MGKGRLGKIQCMFYVCICVCAWVYVCMWTCVFVALGDSALSKKGSWGKLLVIQETYVLTQQFVFI